MTDARGTGEPRGKKSPKTSGTSAFSGLTTAFRKPQTSNDKGTGQQRPFSLLRVGGFALYDAWVLANFYNTFMLNDQGDYRALLYLNMVVSMAALAFTLLVFPLVVRRADKWVLSKSCIVGAGIAMAIATTLSVPASITGASGLAFAVVGALITGISSAILFLGWGRLFADVGSHGALLEIACAWLLAAGIDVVLTLLPAELSIALVVVMAIANALLLRIAVMDRPARPTPAQPHPLHRRTKRMFARGGLAFFAVGFVAGLCDLLAGFRFIPVPAHYELFLALCLAVVAGVIVVIALGSRHTSVLAVRRFTSMVLMLGCALIPFMPVIGGLPSILVFGAYQGINIMLCIVCVDVSNMFDQPACRTFGIAFGVMYLGEIVGDFVCLFLTEQLHLEVSGLLYVSSVLSVIVAFMSLFLLTDTDLLECGLGEMTDDEDDTADVVTTSTATASTATSVAGSSSLFTEASAPATMTIDDVAAIIAQKYGLTPRESDVLPLVLRGRTIARIQEELRISQGTVSTHTRHIYQKTGCHNRQALLDMAEKMMQQGSSQGPSA